MGHWCGVLCLAIVATCAQLGHAADELPRNWPKLPTTNGVVELPAQEWPCRPAPRHIKVYVYYPFGRLEHVTAKTGLMLTIHNWGGTEAIGSAEPKVLTERLDVVSVAVDYLQSGKNEALETPEPYDFGYLQALDALRGLWYVQQGMKVSKTNFDASRIYATGGSAGGHVAMMCNKLAPHTFTCLIDICGPTKLSDDIAYGLPGGSSFNARYEKEDGLPGSLTTDEREIRCLSDPRHLAEMKRLGNATKLIVVHGTDDTTAPFADTKELVEAMQQAKLDVESVFISKSQLDGKVFTATGHTIGHRTEILFRVADKYLRVGSKNYLSRTTSTDFFRREEIRYETTNGAFVISYEKGYPIGKFVPK